MAIADLKKLFKRAHPMEAEGSVVFQHKFITGLCQKVLMKRHPTSLADAIKTVLEVEYMLGFGGQQLQIELIKQSSEETKNDHLDEAIAVLQIAVGHRTFPNHNKRLSEYFVLCTVIFTDSMFKLIYSIVDCVIIY